MPIKKRILSYFQPLTPQRHRYVKAAIGVFSGTMLAMMAAFAVVPRSIPEDVSFEVSALPLDLHQEIFTTNDEGTFPHEDRVRNNDTLPILLGRLGIEDQAALTFLLSDASAAVIARQMRPGKVVSATTDGSGRLVSLHFPRNGKQDSFIVVNRQDQHFLTREQTIAAESLISLKAGEIRSSLFAATDSAEIPDAVADQLAEIFAGDIDFHRDLRRGDRFVVAYETIRLRGRAVRSGRILAAEFINAGRRFRAIYHQQSDGNGGYYDPEGKSLRRAFLRSPIEFSRVTSGFSGSRFHPVLKEWRAHRGLDYGAPPGTKVRATGDGTVEIVGRQRGYGNLVVLRHPGSYSTAYGHLSRFASDLRTGSRVRQGDVIGFVGQTGLASGPHLHYEFRVRDQPVNPLLIEMPEAPPLTAASLTEFRLSARAAVEQLSLASPSAGAQFD